MVAAENIAVGLVLPSTCQQKIAACLETHGHSGLVPSALHSRGVQMFEISTDTELSVLLLAGCVGDYSESDEYRLRGTGLAA